MVNNDVKYSNALLCWETVTYQAPPRGNGVPAQEVTTPQMLGWIKAWDI